MSKWYLADKARNKNGSCATSPQLLKKNTQVKPLCYVCGAHKLSSIDIVSFWMASITANVTFSRWSMKCRQSCLVLVMWKIYKVGKQAASAPPRSLRKFLKRFPNQHEWVVGKGAGEFTCTAFYISSMHTKQTTSKKILNLANCYLQWRLAWYFR